MSSSGEHERPARGPDGSHGDWRRYDDPETAVWVERTENAIRRWGAAYVAWILLEGTDPRHLESEAKFVDNYAGWYPSRRRLYHAQIENLGWLDALEAFKTAHGLPPHALAFDWERIWEHCSEVYDVEERLGGVHAFMR